MSESISHARVPRHDKNQTNITKLKLYNDKNIAETRINVYYQLCRITVVTYNSTQFDAVCQMYSKVNKTAIAKLC